ncbi:MAG: hypothetical protein NW226_07635 [Microscillaceae bacterium]|nr:hypothetical protein [Microscillaceae bacterium]
MMYFTIHTEKIEHKGEDAEPTLLLGDDDSGVLAVYDGMGGAGSKTYTVLSLNREVVHSGAYIASRLAKSILEDFYFHTDSTDDFVENLRLSLKEGFQEYYLQLDDQPSKLRSKLIKNLPTTLAGIYFQLAVKGNLELTAFWAGDSRCYILQKDGLQQLSLDDLNGMPDALSNLSEDATISNCISADGNFVLNTRNYSVQNPCILITATDGCFGYLPSPAHFEYIILDTLMNSYFDVEDWKEKLTESLSEYTADDTSMSLLCLGFSNLNQLKTEFYPRFAILFQQFIQPLEEIDDKIERSLHSVVEEIDFAETRKELLKSLWEKYKINYYPEF